MIGMLADDLVGPRDRLVARPELERQNEVLLAVRFERVVAVLQLARFHDAAEAGELRQFLGREVIVQHRRTVGRRAVLAVVVIPRRQGVRNLAIEPAHRRLRDLPLLGDVVVRDVPFVEHVLDVEPLSVVGNPLRLVVEVLIPLWPHRVDLRVRHRDDHERIRIAQLHRIARLLRIGFRGALDRQRLQFHFAELDRVAFRLQRDRAADEDLRRAGVE